MLECRAEEGSERRVQEYLQAGARLVWVVDPKSLTVAVCSRTAPRYTVGLGQVLDGGQVLPGFRCRVEDIFRRSGAQE